MTKPEVEQLYGKPTRGYTARELEFWIYDLRRCGEMDYSIRVVFGEDRVCQCYLGMEACELPRVAA